MGCQVYGEIIGEILYGSMDLSINGSMDQWIYSKTVLQYVIGWERLIHELNSIINQINNEINEKNVVIIVIIIVIIAIVVIVIIS